MEIMDSPLTERVVQIRRCRACSPAVAPSKRVRPSAKTNGFHRPGIGPWQTSPNCWGAAARASILRVKGGTVGSLGLPGNPRAGE
jgi:hypothetical protein